MGMELEKQVCSRELSHRLDELGVKRESYFWWTDYGVPHIITAESGKSIFYEKTQKQRCYAAYTVAELGEMLPLSIGNVHFKPGELAYRLFTTWNDHEGWSCAYCPPGGGNDDYALHVADTEADARAKMLVYLLENSLITL